jgi:Raf kinase inhibitor-like YbhB/YbcL family protein
MTLDSIRRPYTIIFDFFLKVVVFEGILSNPDPRRQLGLENPMTQSRRSAVSASLLLRWSAVLVLTLVAAAQIGCGRADGQQQGPSLELRSNSFKSDAIPNMYSSCKGDDDISPELSWKAGPDHTQSFALIVFDKDSPLGFKFTHWVLYDMPSDKRALPENTPKQEELTDGSRQGYNDYDRVSYVGPCPPGHSPHHYVFDLYALDTKLNLPPWILEETGLEGHEGACVGDR